MFDEGGLKRHKLSEHNDSCHVVTTVSYLNRVKLAELHADLFSRHASPLESCVFVAVDERGEAAMSDEIGRRCNGKQQRMGHGG